MNFDDFYNHCNQKINSSYRNNGNYRSHLKTDFTFARENNQGPVNINDKKAINHLL
jgi:hypothetical protein